MKKLIALIICVFLLIGTIIGLYIYSISIASKNIPDNTALKEEILNNYSWKNVTKEDFNGYLNGTYTSSIKTIIASLEEAIPVILHVNSNRFGNNDKGTFVVASAFDTTNKVYVYYHDSNLNEYKKTLVKLESLLEDADSVFIYKRLEGLQ